MSCISLAAPRGATRQQVSFSSPGGWATLKVEVKLVGGRGSKAEYYCVLCTMYFVLYTVYS